MLRLALLCLILGATGTVAEELHGIENPLHGYETAVPQDRFTRWNVELEAGRRTLDTGSELAVLRSLLAELEVPVSSQMLVYSVTSLQKNLISPRRPRALYFNDDTFVAYVPGGRLEIISLDPRLGSMFYISDRVQAGRMPTMRRSEECFNCHAPAYLENIPALLVESVIPGMTGGGERAFRREQTGHSIPLAQRFGGWHVTGLGESFPAHQGNKLIERSAGVARELPLEVGQLFDTSSYLQPTSDVLPQLLQEHQVGFANRVMLAGYRARALLQAAEVDKEALSQQMAALAEPLVRYLLFADEVPLPTGSVPGDPAYRADFLRNRRPSASGAALKDLDLATRLFRYRCSYMIYSPLLAGLSPELKTEVFAQLAAALGEHSPAAFAYLPSAEKQAIRTILQETLPDLPAAWGS